jgi:hypothetical protein
MSAIKFQRHFTVSAAEEDTATTLHHLSGILRYNLTSPFVVAFHNVSPHSDAVVCSSLNHLLNLHPLLPALTPSREMNAVWVSALGSRIIWRRSTNWIRIHYVSVLLLSLCGTRQRSGWGTMPQAGRLRVRDPFRWLDATNNIILQQHKALRLTQPLTEMSTRQTKYFFLGKRRRPVHKAENIIAICEPIF